MAAPRNAGKTVRRDMGSRRSELQILTKANTQVLSQLSCEGLPSPVWSCQRLGVSSKSSLWLLIQGSEPDMRGGCLASACAPCDPFIPNYPSTAAAP